MKIKGTEDTPDINFDTEILKFEMTGRSMPEDAQSFYNPIIDYLEDFKGSKFHLDFKVEYFNTASSKMILDFLMKMEEVSSNGIDVKVNWYYDADDEDMKEAGEEYSELVEIPFEFKEI